LNLRRYRARNGQEITEKMVRTVLNNHQLYLATSSATGAGRTAN
jgi:hypothetical protein